MRKFLYIPMIALFMALAGCSYLGFSTKDDTPAQKLFAIESLYGTAFTFAAQYENLPRCNPGSISVCSSQAIVNDMRAAHVAVKSAFAAAWSVIKTGTASKSDIDATLATVKILVDKAVALYNQVKPIVGGK